MPDAASGGSGAARARRDAEAGARGRSPGRAMTLLVGDIGGTKARLALVSAAGGFGPPLRVATLPSRHFAGPEQLIAEFMHAAPMRLDGVVLAVAGPVVQGRAVLSNLRWVLEEGALRDALDVPRVRLLNDLVAMAHGVAHLGPADLHTLQPGARDPHGPIAVVAPGTGLGEAWLTWDGSRWVAHPSEGGHADFAPTDALQVALLEWLSRRLDHVSYERVCSGMAVPALYDFLRERGVARELPAVAARLAEAEDRTPVITQAAYDDREPCALSRATMDLFAFVLMAEAGNAALRSLATGGVYLGGGLPRRMLGSLVTAAALERFRRKGRLSGFVDRIPLHVVIEPSAALMGAARYAVAEAERW